jgi:hypothetical protein
MFGAAPPFKLFLAKNYSTSHLYQTRLDANPTFTAKTRD